MAEITQGDAEKTDSKKIRSKKQSTKIDMTPMVDLAFLLLTFFILTSTFSKSKVMPLTMPESNGDSTRVSHEKILNLVLAENNKIYWWIGLDPSAEMTSYSNDGVRKILLEKRRSNPDLMVLIKLKDNSKYENMIDILDEMDITNVEKYAIVNFTEDDNFRIERY